MSELITTLATRVRAPILGNTALACFLLNWREFLYLFLENEEISVRITHFDANTSALSLIVFPLAIGFLISSVYPFVSLLSIWISQWPQIQKRRFQARSDSSFDTEQKRLELDQRQLLAQIENELIAQSKRDAEIGEIEDEESREELKRRVDAERSGLDSDGAKEDENESETDQQENWSPEEQILYLTARSDRGTAYVLQTGGVSELVIGDLRFVLNTHESRTMVDAAFTELRSTGFLDLASQGRLQVTASGYAEASNFEREFDQNVSDARDSLASFIDEWNRDPE